MNNITIFSNKSHLLYQGILAASRRRQFQDSAFSSLVAYFVLCSGILPHKTHIHFINLVKNLVDFSSFFSLYLLYRRLVWLYHLL